MNNLLHTMGLGSITRLFRTGVPTHAHEELISPIRDWKVLFLFLCLLCTGGGLFSGWVYLRVNSGTFVEAVPLSTKMPETLDDEELTRVIGILGEREAAFEEAFTRTVPVGDPGR